MLNNEAHIFWSNLEKIKDQLLLNDIELAASIGLKYENFLSYKQKNKTLPMDCLFQLAEKMNFHLEDLLLNDAFSLNYDPHACRPLLDRYNLANHSQTRPLINILNYVELTKGSRAKINLIRKFQLSENFINKENNKTNILLISDIVKYLATKHNFQKSDFLAIGRRMPFIANNDILKDKLTGHKTAIDILESFIYDCTRLFDSNCTYRISEYSANHAVVDVIPNGHVVEELKMTSDGFGNEEVCLTRMGNISSVMHYKYGKNALVKKINSIHNGHQFNQYLFDLTPFKKMDQYLGSSCNPSKLQILH